MSSVHSLVIDSSQRQEAHQAARILINRWPKRLEDFLVDGGFATNWLRDVCVREDLDFIGVMSSSTAQDITPSQSSQRETLPSPPSSRHRSSSSTVLSSSASNQPSSTTNSIKIVAIINDDLERLSAKSVPNSCYLIRGDTVENRLQLTADRLLGPAVVCNNGESLKSYESISLRWAWSKEDMELGRIQRNTFYLVPELSKIEILLGDSEPHEIQRPKNAVLPEETNVFDDLGNANPPLENSHGRQFEQPVPGEFSTVYYTQGSRSTVRHDPPSQSSPSNQPDQIPGKRRQSMKSDSSRSSNTPRPSTKIPRPASSSPVEGPSVATWSAPETSSGRSPNPNSPTSGFFNVTLMCWGNSGTLRIELDAPGETFFNSLENEVKKIMKRTPRKLNRAAHYVRLASRRDISGETCLVYLTENQVEDSWMEAVQWINEVREHSSCRIYALLETD